MTKQHAAIGLPPPGSLEGHPARAPGGTCVWLPLQGRRKQSEAKRTSKELSGLSSQRASSEIQHLPTAHWPELCRLERPPAQVNVSFRFCSQGQQSSVQPRCPRTRLPWMLPAWLSWGRWCAVSATSSHCHHRDPGSGPPLLERASTSRARSQLPRSFPSSSCLRPQTQRF